HVRLRFWRAAGGMDHLVRNADGDELLIIHQGGGDLFCDYGRLAFTAGDYILLPRGTMWRIAPAAPVAALMIACTNASNTLPDRGMLGPTAVFDPAVLDTPRIDSAFRAQQERPGKWRVMVKRGNAISTITYPFNPLDAVGWHGDLAPV